MADEKAKPVPTPARLAANRPNAQKSTGPRTAAGKRRAALNSHRHGLVPPEIERQSRPESGQERSAETKPIEAIANKGRIISDLRGNRRKRSHDE